jgi:type IV pilus assembly protein PilQ
MNYKIRKLLNKRIITFFIALIVGAFVGCAPKASVKPSQEELGKTSGPKLITEIIAEEDSGSIMVLVKGNVPLTFTSVKQPHPPAVILYFPETALDNVDPSIFPPINLINSIKASELAENEHTIRVEIALKKDLPYEVIPEDPGLRITFKKAPDMPVSAQPAEAAQEAPAVTQQETQPYEKGYSPATRLETVYATKVTNGLKINVRADGSIKDYNAFTIDNPARIVFDLFNIKSDYKREHLVSVNSEWAKSIRHFGYPDRLRLVIDTKKSYLTDFTAYPVENGLLIQLGKVEASAEASMQKTKVSPAKASQPAWVNRIDFSSGETGKSTVIVGTTRRVDYKMKKVGDRRLQLELYHTRLPAYRQRPLITTRFESAVDRIIPVQTAAMRNTTQISLEMRESVPYLIEQADDLLLIHFEASAIPPRPLEEADLPSWKKVFSQTVTEATAITEEPVEAAKAAEAVEAVEAVGAKPAPKYTGEKIALDFYETNIKNVFRILREISNKNFAIDKDVKGTVSLTLQEPVPWDQVLDLILRMNQLGKKYEGNIIRIATLKTLQAEENAKKAALQAKKAAIESQKALEPLITEYIPISYSNAQTEIEPNLRQIITKDRGILSVDGRNNQIIITDTAEVIRQAKEIIQNIDKVTPQVIIEARIVEADSNFSKELGTVWGAGYGNQSTGVLNNVNEALTPAVAADLNALVGTTDMPYGFNASSNLGNLSQFTDPAFGFNFIRIAGTPLVLNAKIMAKEVEGDLKIISTPKVVTLDNKKAVIKQGLQYPYNKLDADGNTVTEFKDITLELEVTPHVTPDQRVSMEIKIQKKDLGTIINSQQSFTNKEAETILLVDDGDTVVIGGIIKATKEFGKQGIPGLSKIPIVGWLFKAESKQRRKEELLIFITPRIVQLEQRA